MTDFDELAETLDAPPMLYAATLAAIERHSGTGADLRVVGADAWHTLTGPERPDALRDLLGCYTQRVLDEEIERNHQAAANDEHLHTCLQDHDLTIAWDSVLDDTQLTLATGEVGIDRDTLRRLLDELELLRRRATIPTTESAP